MPRQQRQIHTEEKEEDHRRVRAPQREHSKEFFPLVGETLLPDQAIQPEAVFADSRLTHPANTARRATFVRTLQQQVGNAVVQRLLRSGVIQAKLTDGKALPGHGFAHAIQRSQDEIVLSSNTTTIFRNGGPTVEEAPEAEIEMSRGRDVGVRGSDPVGHESGWAFGLSSTLVLDLQSQYESRADIPYDAVRCGAAALLGAAIAQGPRGLTALIDRLKIDVDRTEMAEEPSLLPLSVQRQKMAAIHHNWHFYPGAAWNLFPPSEQEDPHPFTFDQLSWLQAIVYAMYVSTPGGGMGATEVQSAVRDLTSTRSAAPVSPGSYQTITNATQAFPTIVHNNTEVVRRFIARGAPARLSPGQSVILKIMSIVEEDHNWVVNSHAVTLSNINGTFYIYNPEMTLLPDAVFDHLPNTMQRLRGLDLSGNHLARAGAEGEVETTIFGLTIGLVTEELTAPFRF